MSFKARKQFRPRKATEDDEEEDENEVVTSVTAVGTSTNESSSSNKRKVLKGPSLSFTEEEEGDGDIKLKKSKASKLVKRMKQAPVDMSALIQDAPVAVHSFASSSGSGAYSADSLAALRQQQKYAEPSTTVTDEMDVDNDVTAVNTRQNRNAGGGGLEGMELTGEEAETMEELTERLEANGNDAGMHFSSMVSVKGSTSVRFLDEKQELADRDALHQSRMALSQQIRKTDVDKDRLSMGQTTQPTVRRDFVALEEEASEWEMEIVNRGKGALLKGAMASSRSTGGRNASGGSGSSSSGLGVPIRDVLTIEDVQIALQRAADAITTSLEDADRRKDRLQQDIKTMSEKDNHLQTKVVAGVNHLNNLRELRVFCAEVVGMLRDKEGMITKLRHAAIEVMIERQSKLQQRRCEDQEDLLHRIREAGELISIGAYQPRSLLTESMHTSEKEKVKEEKYQEEEQVDEFGRAISKKQSILATHRQSTLLKELPEREVSRRKRLLTFLLQGVGQGQGQGQGPLSSSRNGMDVPALLLSIDDIAIAPVNTITNTSTSGSGSGDGDDSAVTINRGGLRLGAGLGSGLGLGLEDETALREKELDAYYNPKKPSKAGLGSGLGSTAGLGSGGGLGLGAGLGAGLGGSNMGLGSSSSGFVSSSAPARGLSMFVKAGGGAGSAGSSSSGSVSNSSASGVVQNGGTAMAVDPSSVGSVVSSSSFCIGASVSASMDTNGGSVGGGGVGGNAPSSSSSQRSTPVETISYSSLQTAITAFEWSLWQRLMNSTGADTITTTAGEEDDNIDVDTNEALADARKSDIIREAATVLMTDVRSEIASIGEILDQLGQFREQLWDRYRSAYVSLSLPALLELLVVLDAVVAPWLDTPSDRGSGTVDDSPSVLMQRPWYVYVTSYSDRCPLANDNTTTTKSHTNTASSSSSSSSSSTTPAPPSMEEQGDVYLLPRLVSLAVVPWIEQLLTHGLDPLSSRQCRAAAKACRDVCEIMGNMAMALGLPPPQQQQQQQKEQKPTQQQGNGHHTLTPTHTSHLLTSTLLESFSKSFRTLCFPILRIPHLTRSHDATSKNSTKSGVTMGICFVMQQLRRCMKLLRNLEIFAVSIMSEEGWKSVGKVVWEWLTMDVRPMLIPMLSWVVMKKKENEQDDMDEGEDDDCVVISTVLNFLLVLIVVLGPGLGPAPGQGLGQGLAPGQGLGLGLDKTTMTFTTKVHVFRTTLQDLRTSLSVGGGGAGAGGGTSSSTARTKIDPRVWVTVSRVDMIRVGNVLLNALQGL